MISKQLIGKTLAVAAIATLAWGTYSQAQFESLEQLIQQRNSLQWDIRNLENTRDQRANFLKAEEQRLTHVGVQIGQLQPRLDLSRQRVPVLRQEKEAAEAHVRAAQNALAQIEAKDNADSAVISQLEGEIPNDQQEVNQLRAQIPGLTQRLADAKAHAKVLDQKKIDNWNRYNELEAEKQDLFERINALWKEHGADGTSEERKVQIVNEIHQYENVRLPQIAEAQPKFWELKEKYEQEAAEHDAKVTWQAMYDLNVAKANADRIENEIKDKRSRVQNARNAIAGRVGSKQFETNKVETQQNIANQKASEIQKLGLPEVLQQEMNGLLSSQQKLNTSVFSLRKEIQDIAGRISQIVTRVDMVNQRIVVQSPIVLRNKLAYQEGGAGGISLTTPFSSAMPNLPSPTTRKLPGGREVHFYTAGFSILWSNNNPHAEPEMIVARPGYAGALRGRDLSGAPLEIVFQQDLKFLMTQDLNNDKKLDELDLMAALDRGFAGSTSICVPGPFTSCIFETLSYNSSTGEADMLITLENSALRIGRKRVSMSSNEVRYFIQGIALTKESMSSKPMLRSLVKQVLTMP